jgi:hypothetical protein
LPRRRGDLIVKSGGSMTRTATLPRTVRSDNAPSSREQTLARYRQLREISTRHHHEILSLIPSNVLFSQARRLGLAEGKTLILEDMEEMNYVHDLAIYTASATRTRAIDRYARSPRFSAGSDEALVLEAMRAARFAILLMEGRHETAGIIATDLLRGAEVWLVDIGLESSLSDGEMFATRLFSPEPFSMTAGISVPFDLEMLPAIVDELPRRLGDSPRASLANNRQFAEAIYRIALADGVMDH